MSESEWWGWDGLPSLGLAGLMHIGEQGWKDMRWGGLCVVIIIIMIIIIITRPSALTTMKNSQRVLKSLCFYFFYFINLFNSDYSKQRWESFNSKFDPNKLRIHLDIRLRS